MVIQWEIVPVLAETFGLSRSAVRRDLAGGGFYVLAGGAWQRIPAADDDVFEADGVPARAVLRHGKRDVRTWECPS